MIGEKKRALTAIMGPAKHEEVEGDEPDALHAIASEFIQAVKADDAQGVADCWRAAFEELDREPQEGTHEE